MARTTVVLAIVLSGCSFIDDFDFEVVDGGRDGVSEDAVLEDTVTTDAARDVSVGMDSGDDAGSECAGECYDAFDSIEGGGAWAFMRQDADFDVLEQTRGERFGSPAWVAPGGGVPAITACAVETDRCAGLVGSLLLEADGEGTTDPALVFTAPETGEYQFDFTRQRIEGMTRIPVSRNRPHDDVLELGLGPFRFAIDLIAGDTLRIVMDSGDGRGADAIRVRATRLGPIARCQSVIRFDDDALTVDCGAGTLRENGEGDARTAFLDTGVVGGARSIDRPAALLLSGAAFDYSGDFTMQMWIRVASVQYNGTSVFADWSTASANGVSFEIATSTLAGANQDTLRFGYFAPPGTLEPELCNDSRCTGFIEYNIEGDSAWHFYRVVRDSGANEARLCVDGELVGTSALPGELDLTSGRPPSFGRWGSASPYFYGAVDDFRLIDEVLPCGE